MVDPNRAIQELSKILRQSANSRDDSRRWSNELVPRKKLNYSPDFEDAARWKASPSLSFDFVVRDSSLAEDSTLVSLVRVQQ